MIPQDERTWHRRDTLWLSVSIGALALLTLGAWVLMGPTAIFIVIVAAVALLAGLQLHLYRRRKADDMEQRRYLQSLLFLFATLDIRMPLPSLTGWAASPQLASILVSLIRSERPRLILEAGSGASTIIMAYAVEQAGEGRVVSLDHNEAYAAKTNAQLADHGLEHVAAVRHAPLTAFDERGEQWTWYDRSVIDEDTTIDMVVIDGPPRETGRMARYPAVPALNEALGERAVIVLDDAYRDEEQAILDRWMRELDDFELDVQDAPNGVAVLRRTSVGARGADGLSAGTGARETND